MKIFISGGSGFVGGHLCRELLSSGHSLKLLAHSSRPADEPASSLSRVMLPAADCMLRQAAMLSLIGRNHRSSERGVTLTASISKQQETWLKARQNGINRYLQMSALGSRKGAVSGYHRSKYAAEELVVASGLDYTIFRPSLIFGPKDAFVNMLAGFIRSSPIVPVIGDGKYRMQPISADDVARCYAIALKKPETIGKGYNICGPDRLTYLEIVDAVAKVLAGFCPEDENRCC
jgi:NADH dehydrogenase